MKACPLIVRPWLKAGLSALLVENEERVLALRGPSEAKSGEDAAQAAPTAARPAPPAFQPSCPGLNSAFPRPAPRPTAPQNAQPNVPPKPSVAPDHRGSAPAQPRAGSPVSAQPRPAVQPQGQTMQTLLATPGALPPERWPAAWLALKNRRPLPPRPLVLWTYAGLGDDLTGTPDEARRRVVVRMLTELKHPAGTHVFWPFALDGEAPSPEASLFWSGVKMLDPRVLLLFGSDTRDALDMPKTLKPFGQMRVHGRLIIQLPRPQTLAEDEAAFRQVQAFLARMLRFCCSR